MGDKGRGGGGEFHRANRRLFLCGSYIKFGLRKVQRWTVQGFAVTEIRRHRDAVVTNGADGRRPGWIQSQIHAGN